MPFETLIHQITAAGFQALYLAPFLIGAYIAWHHMTSRRGAPVVVQIR